jgi:glycosyltransferase involved in cell wall biosynthesis
MEISENEIKEMQKKPDVTMAEMAPLPPEDAVEELSDIAVRILCGAEIFEGQNFNSKMIRLSIGGMEQVIHQDDLLIAKWAADKTFREFIKPGHLELMVKSLPYMLECRKWIRSVILDHYSNLDSKTRVLFLRGDNTGCGYWRVKLPGDFLKSCEDSNMIVHVSDLQIEYDKLVQYDVIVVQRVFDFDQYLILDSLKAAGKKIIYEIDDDVFNVAAHNPAAVIFNRFDTKLCIKQCLNLADAVIVTTERLAAALGVQDKAIVYPNSLDWDTIFYSTKKETSQDKIRLFWAGSNTHNEDFKVCLPALIRIFTERDDVELMIMGGCPEIIVKGMECFMDRIHICQGMHTEAYFNYMQNNLEADIGIIPLANTVFNHGKSTCKGLEYTLARIPFVASNYPPYSDTYENNEDALLCSDEDEWYDAITTLLENREMREELIKKARKKAAEKFNLRRNAYKLGQQISEIGLDVVTNRNLQKTGLLNNPEAAQNL